MTGAGDLRCRVEVLERVSEENALGETTTRLEPVRRVWAQIVPLCGRTADAGGGMERVEVSHRFTFRSSALPGLSIDTKFRYRGQDYAVAYFYPNYRTGGFLDVFCKLEVEDRVQGV